MTQFNRFSVVFVLLFALFLRGELAVAQPTSAPPLALIPDAPGIATACNMLPVQNGEGIRGNPNTGYALSLRQGILAFAQAHFVDATAFYWAAFIQVARDPHTSARPLFAQIGEQVLVGLRAQQTSENVPQRCALLTCLIARTTEAEHAGFARESRELACNTPVHQPEPIDPTPPPIERFTLGGERLLALQEPINAALLAEIRRDPHSVIIEGVGDAARWQVPVTYSAQVEAAYQRYQDSHRLVVHPPIVTRPTPHGRSVAGYVVPVSLWATGALAVTAAAFVGASCSSANELLSQANAGQTDGWPREAARLAADRCTQFNVFLPVGLALLGGGTASWVLLRPRPVSVAPVIRASNTSFGLEIVGQF